MPPAPIVVLDTNAVLDMLLFRDPSGAALYTAITAGTVCWQATPSMRGELQHLLTRADFRAWGVTAEQLWQGWDRHCAQVEPGLAAVRHGLRCTDADDQKFIDFAVDCGARWLVTRDRAVLKLARRLRAHRVIATRPAAWSLDHAAI